MQTNQMFRKTFGLLWGSLKKITIYGQNEEFLVLKEVVLIAATVL